MRFVSSSALTDVFSVHHRVFATISLICHLRVTANTLLCATADAHLSATADALLCVTADAHFRVTAGTHLCVTAGTHLCVTVEAHLRVTADAHLCVSLLAQSHKQWIRDAVLPPQVHVFQSCIHHSLQKLMHATVLARSRAYHTRAHSEHCASHSFRANAQWLVAWLWTYVHALHTQVHRHTQTHTHTHTHTPQRLQLTFHLCSSTLLAITQCGTYIVFLHVLHVRLAVWDSTAQKKWQ